MSSAGSNLLINQDVSAMTGIDVSVVTEWY